MTQKAFLQHPLWTIGTDSMCTQPFFAPAPFSIMVRRKCSHCSQAHINDIRVLRQDIKATSSFFLKGVKYIIPHFAGMTQPWG